MKQPLPTFDPLALEELDYICMVWGELNVAQN